MTSAEEKRLQQDYNAWTNWGPYVAERAWGTVREDYSENGDAWSSFTYEDARSRAYRWNEDGLFGMCDRNQRWCLGLVLWNGRDPHLKERLFGLNGHEGNHAEDVKEEWWYLDSTPTHSYGRAAYAYPRMEFPYEELRAENRKRNRLEREYELLDTGIFDDGWWDVAVTHAKADVDDLVMEITATNTSTETDTLHMLPTIWFRNRWSWGRSDKPKPTICEGDGGTIVLDEDLEGTLVLTVTSGGTILTCENDTNRPLVHGEEATTPYPKCGINDHVISGTPTVNPDNEGTKASVWHQFEVGAGETVTLQLRLAPESRSLDDVNDIIEKRRVEANEYYDRLYPADASEDRRAIIRQSLAGLSYSKQWYHFDVDMWLDGDPASPPPPASRLHGRNTRWRHLNNADVIAMPDTWEYPWYAAWDSAFHCLPFTLIDPTFAKRQLILLGREWYQHPNGQLPAYEWSFSDVNPPVQAWAALRVFELDGGWDTDFLERIMHKLMLNFTWWVNRRDADGNNIFDGGFLGLDNIGPFNRSEGLGHGRLEQADATGWMGMFALDLLDMALRLTQDRGTYEDLATKFVEHFAYISTSMDEHDLWNEDDGFYYDMFRDGGTNTPIALRSMVGLIPIFATRVISAEQLDSLPNFRNHFEWFRENKPEHAKHMWKNERGDFLLSLVSPDRLVRLLEKALDQDEFLSDFGLRGMSKAHGEEPYTLSLGGQNFSVHYEPGESESSLFGGNSNWRGPVWFPLNYLLIESLRRFSHWPDEPIMVEFPSGSGRRIDLASLADELGERLVKLFEVDPDDGRRPSMPDHPLYAEGGAWHDRLLFHEYFHGDTGRGLGASHQTGWTALVASLATNSATPFGRRRRKR